MNRIRIDRQPEVSRRKPTLLSILSGKGGVGKTVIAYNLAERTSALGLSTLLIDVDVTCGNLHILANVGTDVGLFEYLQGEKTLAESVITVSPKLSLLSSRGDMFELDEALSMKLITKLRNEAIAYDVIILDHPSGRSKATPILAYGSDLNLLTVIPELTSISDAYGLFRHLMAHDASLDCQLLINRAQDMEEADFLKKRFIAMCEQFASHTITCAGVLLEDKAIRRSVAAQRAASQINSQSKVVQSLTRLVRRLFSLPTEPKVRRATFPEQRINETVATADIRE